MSIRLTDDNIDKYSAEYWCIASDKILLEELDKLNKETSNAIKDKKFQAMVVNKLKTMPIAQKDGMVNEELISILILTASVLGLGFGVYQEIKSTNAMAKQQAHDKELMKQQQAYDRRQKLDYIASQHPSFEKLHTMIPTYYTASDYQNIAAKMTDDDVFQIFSRIMDLDRMGTNSATLEDKYRTFSWLTNGTDQGKVAVVMAIYDKLKQSGQLSAVTIEDVNNEVNKIKTGEIELNTPTFINQNSIEELPPEDVNKPNYALYIGVAAAAAIGIPYLWKRAKLLTDYIKSGECIAKCVFTADDQEYVFQFDIKTNEWKLKYNDVKVLKYTPYPDKETIASFVRTDFAKKFVEQCKKQFEKLYSVTDYKLLIDALKISNKSKEYACIDYLFENQKIIENNLYKMKYKKEW